MTSVSEAETRVSSAERVPKRTSYAISIAPKPYSKLTEVQLERLLWYQLLRDPTLLLKHKDLAKQKSSNVKYSVVDKNVHVSRFVKMKH